MTAIALREAADRDFAVMLGEAAPADGERYADDVEAPPTLRLLRAMLARLHAGGCRAMWAIEADGVVVGLCGFKDPPSAGRAEIGYGIAPSYRNRGVMTAAVAQIAACAARYGATTIEARTALGNAASQRVLERNGFARLGTAVDPDDGVVARWELTIGS